MKEFVEPYSNTFFARLELSGTLDIETITGYLTSELPVPTRSICICGGLCSGLPNLHVGSCLGKSRARLTMTTRLTTATNCPGSQVCVLKSRVEDRRIVG